MTPTQNTWLTALKHSAFTDSVMSCYLGCKDYKKYLASQKIGDIVMVLDLMEKAITVIHRHQPLHLMDNKKFCELKEMVVAGRGL
ncbi:MAG: hypothetical protein KAG61_09055 [Bacteriovoracaceae bacterium]|nr:hypothetical protein [Bacteriovoracaceae bacterium]